VEAATATAQEVAAVAEEGLYDCDDDDDVEAQPAEVSNEDMSEFDPEVLESSLLWSTT
jgi:hypothetical protein